MGNLTPTQRRIIQRRLCANTKMYELHPIVRSLSNEVFRILLASIFSSYLSLDYLFLVIECCILFLSAF